MTITLLDDYGTSGAVGREGIEGNKRSSSLSVAASFVTFGVLAATSTGMTLVPPSHPIIGHESRTAGYGAAPLTVQLASRTTPTTSSASQLKQLRESSGLTWDQLARLFGVSRRAVHHWASGDNMNSHNQEVLAKIAAVVAELPGSTPAEKRAELFLARGDQGSAFDRLRRAIASTGGEVNGVPVSLSGLLGIMAD